VSGKVSSFEPLKLQLVDRAGQQVTESIQMIVLRAFEKAMVIPDANINHLILGAARVARVIADGGARKPEEYATTVLRRIALRSQRDFVGRSQPSSSLFKRDVDSLEDALSCSPTVLAKIEIEQLLEILDERDQKIVMMRSHGFRYEQIAPEVGMLAVSVRCRYHIAKNRLRIRAASKR
jgi:DNA-directed RNA polymerase specialized sigma24 family protein